MVEEEIQQHDSEGAVEDRFNNQSGLLKNVKNRGILVGNSNLCSKTT